MIYDFRHLAVKRSIAAALQGALPSKTDRMLGAMGALANATYNYKGGYVSGTNTGVVDTPDSFNVAEIKLDFAAIALLRAAAAQTAFAAADVLQLFEVPAGVWVPAVFAEVLTAEGETATFDVGDGTDVDGFIDGQDANATGWGTVITTGPLATTAFSVAVGGGKLYTATDTIDLLLNTAAFNVGKLRLLACMVDLRSQRT